MGHLKRIDVSELRLGMYIHKLEGSWIKHPFWKVKFVISDQDTLDQLLASEVEGIVIDVDKGDDVPAAGGLARRRSLVSSHSLSGSGSGSGSGSAGIAKPSASTEPELRAPSVISQKGFDPRSTAPQSTAQESQYASQSISRWQKAVSGLLQQVRLGRAISSSQIEPIVNDFLYSIKRNPHALNGLMRVRRENSELYDSLMAVSGLMVALGTCMKLPEAQIKEAGMTGLLMNVGMGYLPIDVSTIQANLPPAEHEIVKTHVKLGHDFLAAGGEIAETVLRGTLEHHERMDGSGYPMALSGDEISLIGRMAGICDVYNSMTSDRAHRKGIDPARALARMKEMDTQFDQTIVDRLIESLGIYPIGAVVLLRSNWLALVVDQNPGNYSRPRVWAFYDVAAGALIKPKAVDLSASNVQDEVTRSVEPAEYGIENFPALREMLFNAACKAAMAA